MAPRDLNVRRVGGLHTQAWDLLFSRIFDGAGRFSASAASAALDWIRQNPPDLVHVHNLHGYWINQRKLLFGLSELNIPVVWTLHDYWPITGHCAYFEKVNCDKWSTGCENCPQTRDYPKSYTDRSIQNFARKKAIYDVLGNVHVVTVSNHSKKIIGNSILSGFPATTIYNSVDTSIFKPTDMATSFPGKAVVGCAARYWDERKGLDDVIELRKLLDESFILLVIGLNKKQIRDLPPGIVGLPPSVSQEEMAALYSSMDIFFNSSREETFGMTTVEAMACGVPVVLYDVSANREIQPEFMRSNMVENRNLSEVADVIMALAAEADGSLKESLIHYVAEKFSRTSFLRSYYGLYHKLLGHRN
jgi:glycosyltransferase involved in cell wall biosynthesis